MLHPWQPHMHVCLLDASALVGRLTSSNRQTHTRANLSVRAGPLPPPHSNRVCASKGVGAGRRAGEWGRMGRGEVGAESEGETGRAGRKWEGAGGRGAALSFTPSVFEPSLISLSWVKSLCLLRHSSGHPLSNCASLCMCNICIYIYTYINIYL